ncbi:hypothetical protein AB0B15_11745 [Streptomyces sp. NPDC045456]|uniref:hypothetical protein n=1 Tax=Streptomyces sp. NPDC045456 TaxID=3155254 RepID=UPI0033FA652E
MVSWFERQITGLPGPMTQELRTWLTIVRLGSRTPPRSKPRPEQSIRIWTEPVVPVLRHWATTHESLREISRKEVKDALDPLQGSRAVRTLRGLRALFRTLKRHQAVFTDPTSRIRMAVPAPSLPLPLDLKPLVAAINSADPAQAALAALFAFHALSPAQARSLPLTAFSNGRLRLADGRVILLAQEARERLQAYVDDRARRWPATTNPHLFITQFTARRTTPVTHQWMNSKLGLPAQAIREDRILDEAQAAGDPRRLCNLFGLSVGGTLRCTAALNHPDLDEISTRTTRPKP